MKIEEGDVDGVMIENPLRSVEQTRIVRSAARGGVVDVFAALWKLWARRNCVAQGRRLEPKEKNLLLRKKMICRQLHSPWH